MPGTQERLRHVLADDGTVHITFPTADLTLCQRPNDKLPATDEACACQRCIQNMHALVRVQAGIAPRSTPKAAV